VAQTVLRGFLASAGVFRVLGQEAALGRTIQPDDDRPGAAPVLVLTDRLWRTRYSADSSILGRGIEIDGRIRSVVGVMSASFDEIPFDFDWWAPLSLSAADAANTDHAI